MRLRLLDRLEAIIRESVKPMEKIEGIKILHVDGLGGGSSRGPAGRAGTNFADSVVNSALRYRAQGAPYRFPAEGNRPLRRRRSRQARQSHARAS